MNEIPRERRSDATLAMLRDPYHFIARRCRELGTDLFRTRFLLERTICMTGEAAARLFYDPTRFVRAGAMPLRIQQTLLGRGGVQGLDGEAHRHRKQMFMNLLSPGRVEELRNEFARQLAADAARWSERGRIVFYDEIQRTLFRSVRTWAGVPYDSAPEAETTELLRRLYDQAAAVGLRHWQSRRARRKAEGWLAGLVRAVRDGSLTPPAGSALQVVATHRDEAGRPLDERVAAVEVLNVLRPVVAASVFITDAAHALHRHGAAAGAVDLDLAIDRHAEAFVQEVRRLYPFFPVAAARVRERFAWNGYTFAKGTLTLLDLHGIDHDARLWERPMSFDPGRFLHRTPTPFSLVPQGGGDPYAGHRCAGERLTIELMKAAVMHLATAVTYEIPAQALELDETRIPALPRSGFVMENVRAAERRHRLRMPALSSA